MFAIAAGSTATRSAGTCTQGRHNGSRQAVRTDRVVLCCFAWAGQLVCTCSVSTPAINGATALLIAMVEYAQRGPATARRPADHVLCAHSQRDGLIVSSHFTTAERNGRIGNAPAMPRTQPSSHFGTECERIVPVLNPNRQTREPIRTFKPTAAQPSESATVPTMH